MERLHGEEDESQHVAGRSSSAPCVFLSLSHGGSSSSSSGEAAAPAPTTPPPPADKQLCRRRRRGQAAAFECRTCGRQFQALGGHRTSNLRRPAAKLRPKPAVVVHACGTCGLGFSTGQALGGHMRRHRRPGFCMDDSEGDVVGFKQIVVHDRPSSASLQLLNLFV